MNICIIGDGLTSLTLAKNLINKKINVCIYRKKKAKSLSSNRTIGITKKNLDFIKKEIFKLKTKDTWKINKIEVFSEKSKDNKILNFEKDKDDLFYMIKNDKFYKLLNQKLLKSKFFKSSVITENVFYEEIINTRKYDLIINCDTNNKISKKFFYKKIDKDYYNLAYTAVLKHEKLENNTATQIFTEGGPIAFLPISNIETSVVCSLEIKNKKYSNDEVWSLIKKNNPNLKIIKSSKLISFKLKSSNLRNYYYKNILAFGDLLHRIHPLAGQGFNMTIRDIRVIIDLIRIRKNLGLQLDQTINKDFESKSRHLNFIFSSGIDFIFEFFNFDNNYIKFYTNKIFKNLNKNKFLNKLIINFADRGLSN